MLIKKLSISSDNKIGDNNTWKIKPITSTIKNPANSKKIINGPKEIFDENLLNNIVNHLDNLFLNGEEQLPLNKKNYYVKKGASKYTIIYEDQENLSYSNLLTIDIQQDVIILPNFKSNPNDEFSEKIKLLKSKTQSFLHYNNKNNPELFNILKILYNEILLNKKENNFDLLLS
jgi:hypothetical protein